MKVHGLAPTGLLMSAWTCKLLFRLVCLPGFNQYYFDQMIPTNSATVNAVMTTELECGRACVDNLECHGYTMARNSIPVGNITCSFFATISGLTRDSDHVLYVVRNSTFQMVWKTQPHNDYKFLCRNVVVIYITYSSNWKQQNTLSELIRS